MLFDDRALSDCPHPCQCRRRFWELDSDYLIFEFACYLDWHDHPPGSTSEWNAYFCRLHFDRDIRLDSPLDSNLQANFGASFITGWDLSRVSLHELLALYFHLLPQPLCHCFQLWSSLLVFVNACRCEWWSLSNARILQRSPVSFC